MNKKVYFAKVYFAIMLASVIVGLMLHVAVTEVLQPRLIESVVAAPAGVYWDYQSPMSPDEVILESCALVVGHDFSHLVCEVFVPEKRELKINSYSEWSTPKGDDNDSIPVVDDNPDTEDNSCSDCKPGWGTNPKKEKDNGDKNHCHDGPPKGGNSNGNGKGGKDK